MKMPTTAAAATTTSRSERMRASFRLTRAALCWVAFGLPLGCNQKKDTPGRGAASSASGLADLPEPPGVVAELALAHPDTTFKALRELGSPMSALLPAGFPLFAATVLGLPPLSADSFDTEVPAVGALTEDPKGDIGWVVALHTLSGPELVAKLSTGDRAPFRALPSDRPGLTRLEPSAGSDPKPRAPTLGVFDNYLLIAESGDSLTSFGPYVARMLPRRPSPRAAVALSISQHALTAQAVPALRAAWASYRTGLARQDQIDRAAHGGRAPDFGDPAQVILALDAGVESALSTLESATSLELDVEPLPNRLEATLSLTPAAGSAAEQLLATFGASDAKPLLTLPAETRVALGVSRSPAERDEAAKAAGDDWVRLLGSRLSEHDAQTLRGVLSDWDLGRGSSSEYGYLGGADSGVFVVADAADRARLLRAGHGFFGLLSLSGVRAPLSEFLGLPHVHESAIADADFATDVQLAKVTFQPNGSLRHAQPMTLPPLDFAWFVEEKTGFGASGKSAIPVLKKVVLAARGVDASLGASPDIAGGVQRIGDQAAVFAYADARAVGAADSPAAAQPAPIFFSIGKRERAAFLRIEVTKPAIEWALNHALGR
jgi:hypothetical protein